MNQEEIIDLLEKNYDILSQTNAKWLDKRVKYLLARIFTGQKEIMPIEDFEWLDTALLHKAGIFSSLTKVTRQTLTGLMISSSKNSVEGIEELFFNKKILKDNGFKSSSSTYFASYQLFFSDSDRRIEIAKRGHLIYEGLKKSHPFITTSNDYSSIISLAQAEQLNHLSEEKVCQLIEFYYETLQEIGLKNKNSCLVVSTLITLLTGELDEKFMTAINELILFFEKNRIKIKSAHFVPLVSLAYIMEETKEIDLNELLIFIEEIEENIKLYFETDYKQALAISLFVESKSRALNKINLMTLSVSLNRIIVQEQTMLADNTVTLLS